MSPASKCSSSGRHTLTMDLESPREQPSDALDGKAESGFFRKLIGGSGSAPSSPKESTEPALKKDKRSLSGSAKSSVPKKVLDMLGPLLLSKGKALRASKPSAGSAVPPSPTASAAVGQQDAKKLVLNRALSASSGLTEYVNKMNISEALGGKRAKQSPCPEANEPLAATQRPAPVAAAPKQPQSSLDRLLEQARHCNLPISPRGPDTVVSPAPGTAPMPSVPSTFGGVPHQTVMLSISATVPPKMHRAKWSLDDYVIMEKLYTGYASTVFKATCLRSGDIVVLKIYTLSAVCDLYKYQIYREVRVHSNLQHENIVHLYASFQQGEKVVMVQEYADGSDLFTLLHKYGGRLSERLAVQMVLDPFLRVLQYLHTRGIIHRDIKPENIMFTKNMCLKLGDFGLAIDLREERAVTRAGTLDYMAPEVLQCPFKSRPNENKENTRLHYSARVDTWAVGVLTYELMVGFPPFFDQSRSGTEDRIKTSVPAFPANMSEEAKGFVCSSLAKSPTDRPTILELLNHTWVDSYRTRRSMRNIQSGPVSPSGIALTPASRAAAIGPTAVRSGAALAPLPAALTSILSNIIDSPCGVAGSKGAAVSTVPHAGKHVQQTSPTSTLTRVDTSSSSSDDASVYMQTSGATGQWPDHQPAGKVAGPAAQVLARFAPELLAHRH